jgi:hypothetical protein
MTELPLDHLVLIDVGHFWIYESIPPLRSQEFQPPTENFSCISPMIRRIRYN